MNDFSILEIPAEEKNKSNEKLSFQEALQTASPVAAKTSNVVTVDTELVNSVVWYFLLEVIL